MSDNPRLKLYAAVYCLTAIAIVLAYMLHGFAHMKVPIHAFLFLDRKYGIGNVSLFAVSD